MDSEIYVWKCPKCGKEESMNCPSIFFTVDNNRPNMECDNCKILMEYYSGNSG